MLLNIYNVYCKIYNSDIILIYNFIIQYMFFNSQISKNTIKYNYKKIIFFYLK